MTKKVRLKKQKSDNDLDCISQLPENILVYILSLLKTKEAARTSVLSRRWAKLWTLIPILNFDAQQTLVDLQLLEQGIKSSLETERLRYVSWVNQVVKSYQGTPKIHKFRIRFDLDKSFRCDIDRWVNFAIEKEVKMLELDLRDYEDFEAGHVNKKYIFPFKSYQKHLRSRNIGFSGCNSLTTLRLVNVEVTGEALEYFLSNCPLLECLYVESSNCLEHLKVDGSSLRLKHLDLHCCWSLKIVEISAINLLSFKYIGPKINMPFKCAPQLVEILIGGSYSEYIIYSYRELSHYLYQLETLTLYVSSNEGMINLPFPLLTNLKQLELIAYASDDESLLAFTSLIEASPFLHRFTLQLEWRTAYIEREAEKPKKCSHQHLKVVEFIGFIGQAVDTELAMYIIENAVRLEKLVFDPRNINLIGSPREFEETKEKRIARRRAKQLRSKVDPRVDFVIL